MPHKQTTLLDILKMMNTEIRLSTLSCILFICSLFMPFIGFHIDAPMLILLSGGARNISLNAVEIIGGYYTALAMLIAGFSMASRRSSNFFPYKNILDGLCFSTIFFILVDAWISNPISQVLGALFDIAPESKKELSAIGYMYPSIGVFMLIASGICLFFADAKR